MMKLILALFALPIVALAQGSTNDYLFYQKPATGPLVPRAVTPTVGRLLGWPTSINSPAAITLGTGLSLSGSTLSATGGTPAWADITGVPANLTSWAAITRASGMDTFVTTPSSANLAATVTDETGTGSLVFSNQPTLLAPKATSLQFTNGNNSGAFTGGTGGLMRLDGGTAVNGGNGGTGGTVSANGASGAVDQGNGGGRGGNGGSILASGGVGVDGINGPHGGFIYTYAGLKSADGTAIGGAGGSINLSGGDAQNGGITGASGGSISTNDGGGSIDTRGTGSIQFGALGTRTTLVGSAATTDKTITMPNATGTILLTDGNGSALTALNASNISSGSLALARIEQAGATNGQAIAWNGTAWAPATISSGATLAANTFTGLQQFSGTGHAGIRLNNLTTAERDALASPAAGMAVWNTTDGRLQLHNGSSWTSGMVRLSGDTMTGALSVSLSALGTTSTAGLSLINSTAAADGAQQVSPALTLRANGWKTTATAASQTVDFIQDVLPVQGAANPTGSWRLRQSINGAAPTTIISVSTVGTILPNGSGLADLGAYNNGFNAIRVRTLQAESGSGTTGASISQDFGVSLGATGMIRFGGGNSDPTSVMTLFILRDADAVMQLGQDTAVVSATAIGQTIKAPDATGTTSTGGSLTLQGGNGTSAGGSVIIRTSATTTPTERARFSSAGVTIGASGTAIASVISATATLDFASTASHECSVANITVTGAAVGDVVALGIPTEAIGTSGVFFGYVSAADTVAIRYHNTDKNNAVDPASGTFRATVIKH
jgi:hypothetical protein